MTRPTARGRRRRRHLALRLRRAAGSGRVRSFELVDGVRTASRCRAGERLQRLAEHFELVWATGWEDKANFYLPTMLGLPELPHADLRRRRPLRLRALEAGAAGRVRPRAAAGLDRRQLRRELLRVGARARASRPCWSRPTRARPGGGPNRGARWPGPRASETGDCRWTGFWPIFFLLVVLKVPVFGALWLVWWASQEPELRPTPKTRGDGYKRRSPGRS